MIIDELILMATTDFEQCVTTLKGKSNDYARANDVLKNFKQSSYVANCTPEQSILVLLGTKISRLSELVTNDKSAKYESTEDTILDMINYLILLKATIRDSELNDK